ncbi:MAG: ABC transporter permease, partial [Actinomycetia bacterium]|nr:ABC transporter permease [Actinomycetes bacterium]
METLFGIPIDNLMVGLTLALLSLLAFLAVLASRNRVLFRIGVRNISRRPAQTGLIVLGLMLATLLVSSSLVTGDTISYSIQSSAVKSLGQTDLIVQPKDVDRGSLAANGNEDDTYIQPQMYEKIEQALNKGDLIDGLAPALTEKVPAAVPGNRRSLPELQISGLTKNYARSFDPLLSKNAQLSISTLEENEAYLNAEAAEKLEVKTGDDLDIFVKSGPANIRVAGIYTEGG